MEATSNSQKTLKGISSLTLVTIITGVVNLLYFSIISRFLSKEEFGLFAAITAVSSVFTNLSEAGIGSALIHKKDLNEEYKNTSFSLSIITGVAFTMLFLLLSGFISELIVGKEMKTPLRWISLTIFFSGMNSVFLGLMNRKLQFFKAGFISLVAIVISSFTAVLLAVHGFGIYAVIVKAIIGSALISIISLFCVKTSFRFTLRREYIGGILHYGGWLSLSVMIRTLADQVDRLMMSRLISVKALGAYNRPKEFVLGIGGQISGIFDTVLFPVLSSIQDEKERMHRAFIESQYHLNIFSMALSMLFICNAPLIIRVFFGEEWIDLSSVFQIVSITLIFGVNSRLGDCYYRSLGLVRQYSFIRVIELTLNVLAILIGYHWSIIGVAISYMLSTMIQTTIKLSYIAYRIGVPQFEMIANVGKGWRCGLFFIPLVFLSHYGLFDSWFGGFVIAALFVAITCVIFLFIPSLLGNKYKEIVFVKIISFIKNKLHIIR